MQSSPKLANYSIINVTFKFKWNSKTKTKWHYSIAVTNCELLKLHSTSTSEILNIIVNDFFIKFCDVLMMMQASTLMSHTSHMSLRGQVCTLHILPSEHSSLCLY